MDQSGARVPSPHGENSQFSPKSPPPHVQTVPNKSSSLATSDQQDIAQKWPFSDGPLRLGSPSSVVEANYLIPVISYSGISPLVSFYDARTGSSMPSQEPILPQDRSSLNQNSSGVSDVVPPQQQMQIEQFHHQQQVIKENLVYTPLNPGIPLPEIDRLRSPFPKTLKLQQGGATSSVSSLLNNPPETSVSGELLEKKVKISEQETTSGDDEIERRRTLQQQQSAKNTGYVNMSGGSDSSTSASSTTASLTTALSTSASTASSSDDSQSRAPKHRGFSESSSGGGSSGGAPALSHPARALQLPQAHNYEELDVIGNGAYGTVYRGRDLSEQGRFVALKKIKITLTDDGVPVSAVREISLLKQLETFRHPNVVRLLDICHGRLERENRLNLVLVFEYVEMDLDSYLKRVPQPGLEPPRIRNLMHQILSGVDFLHCNRIIHRDLKPQNILVDRYDRVKIADFGLARIYDYNMKLTTMVVTLWYRAPEVLLSNSYATPVDIWSCACIFAELFRKRPLFEGHSEGEQLQRIFEVIGTPPEHEWPNDVSLSFNHFRRNFPKPLPDVVPEISSDAADLLQRMLAFVPGSRASARQSLGHQYFDGVTADTFPMDVTSTASTSSGSGSSEISSGSGSSSRLSDITTRRNSKSIDVRGGVGFVSDQASASCSSSNSGAISTTTSGSSVTYASGVASMVVCDDDVLDHRSRNTSSTGAGSVVVGVGNDENNPNSSNITSSSLGHQGVMNKGLGSGQAPLAAAGPLQQQQQQQHSPTLPVSMFSSPPARSTPVASLSTGVSNVSTSEHPR